MDIHIELSALRALDRGSSGMTLLLRDWTAYLLRENPPNELVMLTLEAFSLKENSCRIVYLYAESAEWLGRKADFRACIYSRFASRVGHVVHLDDVRDRDGYCELDASVRSEMFLQWPWRDSLHLIANAELSSDQISLGAAGWFARLGSLLPKGGEGRPGG